MIDIVLIKALATYFVVDTLLFCISENAEDGDLTTMVLNTDEIEFSLHFKTKEPWKEHNKFLEENAKVLIIMGKEECMGEIDQSMLQNTNYVWLSHESLNKFISVHNLRLDSNWLSISSGSNVTTIHEHYAISHQKQFVNELGKWTNEHFLDIPEPDTWVRRHDLQGFTLKNTLHSRPPIVFLNKKKNIFDGYMADVLKSLQASMNFTVSHYVPPDKELGILKRLENGTQYWSGIFGELDKKQADMSVMGLAMSNTRTQIMDFTFSVLMETATLILGRKMLSDGNINARAFVKVFSIELWIFVAFLALLCGFCYFVSHVVHKKNMGSVSHKLHGFVVVGLTFLQLGTRVGKRMSDKVLYMSCFVMCIFVFEGYTAQLTAGMTVGMPKVGLKSFDDIISEQYKITILQGSRADTFFKNAKEGTSVHEVNKNHLDRMKLYSMTIDEVVTLLNLNPKSGFFLSTFFFLNHQDEVKAVMDFAGRDDKPLHISLQKDSELKAAFDYHILKMRRSGLLERLRNKWIEGAKPKDRSDRIFEQDIVVLSFENLFLPASIMAWGIISALVIATIEKMKTSWKFFLIQKKGSFKKLRYREVTSGGEKSEIAILRLTQL